MSIKNHFTSRFQGGSIVEFDYSQLEVIGLAILSGDEQLKKDIRDGLDLHCVNTAQLYEQDYQFVKDQVDKNNHDWVAKRKVVKIFSFQLQYGAGAKTMAESAGVPINKAKEFIEAYYTRYPRVREWQEECIAQVQADAEPTNWKTTGGYPAQRSSLLSPTGRLYRFTEYDAPDFIQERGQMTSFSPTQIKNYPVQGFSTGDVVPLALGYVFRHLLHYQIEDRIVMCNTVHDSIIFDVHPDCDIAVLRDIKRILEDMPRQINRVWPDVGFDLPMKSGIEMGPSWGECIPVDIGA